MILAALEEWKSRLAAAVRTEDKIALYKLADSFDIKDTIDIFIEALFENDPLIKDYAKRFIVKNANEYVIERLLNAVKKNPEKKEDLFGLLEEVCRFDIHLIGHFVKHPERDYRLIALEVIASAAGDKALPYLTQLANDEDNHIRNVILINLSKIGGKKALSTLADMAKNEKDPWVRYAAVESLAKIDDPAAHKVLLEIAKKEENLEVLNTIFVAISRMKDNKILPAMIAIFERVIVRKNQEAFLDFIGHLASFNDILYLSETNARHIAFWVGLFLKENKEEWLIKKALNVLRCSPLFEPHAIALLKEDFDNTIKQELIDILSQIGSGASVAFLEGLADREPHLAKKARHAIETIGQKTT